VAPDDGTFAGLAAYVRRLPPRLGDVRLVAVDGPSGSGKTRFATRLAKDLDAPVVHTDDLLDGWDDQLTFWTRLQAQVLDPLRRGRPARYLRYRWDRGRFGGPPARIEPAAVVLLEGVSAARAAIRPQLSLAVFLTAPSDLRLRRALARDASSTSRNRPSSAAGGGPLGEEPDDVVALRAYLERWRRVEERHFAADATAAHADLIVDGAPRLSHDPDSQYVRLTGHRETT
jgi:hypothetical protein